MTIIERKVCVEPEFLYYDLNAKLLEKVKKVFENECTQENGYILKINKILQQHLPSLFLYIYKQTLIVLLSFYKVRGYYVSNRSRSFC